MELNMIAYLDEVQRKNATRKSDGHLQNFQDWTEEVALELAQEEELVLTACHWAAIHFLRDYYAENEIPASPRILIKEVGEKLHAWHCTYSTLKELFPKGGIKQACRIAGLPEAYCHSC